MLRFAQEFFFSNICQNLREWTKFYSRYFFFFHKEMHALQGKDKMRSVNYKEETAKLQLVEIGTFFFIASEFIYRILFSLMETWFKVNCSMNTYKKLSWFISITSASYLQFKELFRNRIHKLFKIWAPNIKMPMQIFDAITGIKIDIKYN